MAYYNAGIGNGWMCPDEARIMENLNPLPDGLGAHFYRSANTIPIDDPVEHPTEPAVPLAPNPPAKKKIGNAGQPPASPTGE